VSRRSLALAVVACAGLFLVHARVAVFLAILLAAYALTDTALHLADRPVWRSVGRMVWRGVIIALPAILLILPWFVQVAGQVAGGSGAPRPGPTPLTELPWGYINPGFGRLVFWLALAGLAWSVLKGRSFGLLLVLWSGLLYIMANKGVVAIPWRTGINQNSVDIFLFIPLCALSGWLVGDGLEMLQGGWARLRSLMPRRAAAVFDGLLLAALAAALCVLSSLGAQKMLPLVSPNTTLIRLADLPALAWAESRIPQNEVVLINPFLWGYGIYAGQDGGYYLSSLAGRATLPPPVLYADGSQESKQRIVELSRQVSELGHDPAALRRLMDANGMRYIFLGARGGVISPKALRQSELFELMYAEDGVFIFQTR
jgi:hypothetical protein